MRKEVKEEKESAADLLTKELSQRARREYVMKALFLAEFHEKEEQEAQAELFFRMENLSDELVDALLSRYRWAVLCLSRVDLILAEAMQGWSLSRIGKAELAILRHAAIEIFFDPEIPTAVSINEAVELAKRYGAESSGGFVNGVLGRVVRRHDSESI